MNMDPKSSQAPHDCPSCGHPAYIGGPEMPTQCTERDCPFYSEDCWVLHVMALPDEEVGQEFDIENEPTNPGYSLRDHLKDQAIEDLVYKPRTAAGQIQKALDYLNKGLDIDD